MSQQVRPVTNVFYFAADLQAGMAWYRALLGSDPVDGQPQLAMFEVGSARLTVHVNDDYSTSAGVAGPVAYRDVDEVDAVVAECLERGGTAGAEDDLHRRAAGSGARPVREPGRLQAGAAVTRESVLVDKVDD